MKPIIVWSLFDSGNGSYSKVLSQSGHFINYSIGLDIENKNDHFINLDLASYERMFDNDTLFHTLYKLPRPDIIIASPPCESWSIASAMKGGNACWRQTKANTDFTLRTSEEYDNSRYNKHDQHLKRINGELCTINTFHIAERFVPKILIIENPMNSKIWQYIYLILGIKLEDNITHYNNYGHDTMKPTNFLSNIDLKLDKTKRKPDKLTQDVSGYNNRSDIPEDLVKKIFNECYLYIKECYNA